MSTAFSRRERLLVTLCLVWVVGCYGSMCGMMLFVLAGGDLVAVVVTITPTITKTQYATPLPTFTAYPTSTRTPAPTITPLFPDYFFPTATPVSTLTPNPEDTATFTPVPAAVAVPTETPTLMIVPTVTKKSTGVPPFILCTCTGGDTLNCESFDNLEEGAAQQCFDYCVSEGYGDVHGLDREDDNLACE